MTESILPDAAARFAIINDLDANLVVEAAAAQEKQPVCGKAAQPF